MRGTILCKLILTAALAAAAVTAPAVRAQTAIRFDLPAQPLAESLKAVANQTNTNVLFDLKLVEGLRAPALRAELTPEAAVAQLLSGTGVSHELVNEHTIVLGTANIKKEAAKPAAGLAPAQSLRLALAEASPEGDEAPAANEEAAADVRAKGVPEILVKGSRTMNVDVVRSEDDVQPYTIFTSEQIERSGALTTEDFLKKQLTMNTTFMTSSQLYGSDNGTISSINLRGLGAGETLILVNGRRLSSVNINQFTHVLGGTQPDINGIPLSAIERIEILPSSASAIYGGAALGGVVNVVLKREFTSGELGVTYSNATHGSAPTTMVNGSYGFTVDSTRTQIFLGGSYSEADTLTLRDRKDLIDSNIAAIVRNNPSYLFIAGSPFSGAATNISSFPTFDFANFPACSLGPGGFAGCIATPDLVLKDNTALGSPITSVPTQAGADINAGLLANAGTYNVNLSPGTGMYGLMNPFGSSPRTRSFFTTLRQPVFGNVEAFTELSVNTNDGLARGMDGIPAGVYQVSPASPVNPFQQTIAVTIPSDDAVLQQTHSETKSVTVGLLIPLGTWSSEIDYTWSQNVFRFSSVGVDSTAITAALEAGTINPFISDPLSLNLRGYLGPQTYSGDSTLNDLSFRASGAVGSLPAGAPTVTVGIGHRKEGSGDARYLQDYPLTPGERIEGIYFGRSQSTTSAYLEALIPLVSARNSLWGIHSLDLQLAGRTERYTVYNGTAFAYLSPESYVQSNPPQGVEVTTRYTSTNPTIGLKYAPVAGLTFRASYATAFLPPTPAQLLANPTRVCTGGTGCLQINDPDTGLTYLVDVTAGGNPDLQPQTSTSWTFGAILEPRMRMLEGLRLNLEYYKITQPNYIVFPTAQQVVNDPSLADRITRDSTSGLITLVNTSYANAAEYRTSGWDFKLDYSRPTPIGTFGVRVGGTVIEHDLRQLAVGSAFLSYLNFPNDGGTIKTKANASVQWTEKNWDAAWTTTYYSGYRQAYTAESPYHLQNPNFNAPVAGAQGSASIPSQAYHDVFLSYKFGGSVLPGRMLSNTILQVGVNNVFNTVPPFDAYNRPYFYSPLGDVYLRTYRLNMKTSF